MLGGKEERKGKPGKRMRNVANFTVLLRTGYTAKSVNSDSKVLKALKLENFGTKRKQEGREWVEQGRV